MVVNVTLLWGEHCGAFANAIHYANILLIENAETDFLNFKKNGGGYYEILKRS